ncbi:MAG: hypothetical protein IKQ54_03785 [Oscillospiraceae bacterium]|nr:hypothetical protein [Oscillospiraceae bacterium]
MKQYKKIGSGILILFFLCICILCAGCKSSGVSAEGMPAESTGFISAAEAQTGSLASAPELTTAPVASSTEAIRTEIPESPADESTVPPKELPAVPDQTESKATEPKPTETISTTEEASGQESANIDQVAIDYVNRYLDAIYLYKEPDFRANTVLQLSDPPANGIQKFISAVNEVRTYRKEAEISRLNFVKQTSVSSVSQNENSAKVRLYATVSFQYTEEEPATYCGDNIEITFVKTKQGWLISDAMTEELKAYGLLG